MNRRTYALPLCALIALAGAIPLLMGPTGGFPSRPRVQTLTATTAISGATGAVNLTSSLPGLHWNESDAAANNRLWQCFAQAEQWRCAVANDAGSNTDWLAVDRTGTTVDSIALAATSITLNGVASSDFARLSQTNVFTGGRIDLSSSAPFFMLQETDAAADNRAWPFQANGEKLAGLACPDSLSGCANWMEVNRTAAVIDSVNLTGTAIQTNGVNITAANGTFTCTLTGFAANPSGTCNWSKTGNHVTLYLSNAAITGTSNATSMTMTGIPAALAPVNAQEGPIEGCRDNGVLDLLCTGNIGAAATTMTLTRVTVSGSNVIGSSGWTNSGTKGIESGWSFRYVLD